MGAQVFFKWENTPETFHFKFNKNIDVVDKFLCQLPEITSAFMIIFVYVPIPVHFSLEIPRSLEPIFCNVKLSDIFFTSGNFGICVFHPNIFFLRQCTASWVPLTISYHLHFLRISEHVSGASSEWRTLVYVYIHLYVFFCFS